MLSVTSREQEGIKALEWLLLKAVLTTFLWPVPCVAGVFSPGQQPLIFALHAGSCHLMTQKGFSPFISAGFLLFSESHLSFPLSFPCVFPCSLPGVCLLEFRMGLQCCPGAERMFLTDAWRITAGMCRTCSRSVVLVAVGRTGAILHLEVSRWEKPMGHAGSQHCLPSTENPTAALLLGKIYNPFKSTNKKYFCR